eukprot:1192828-Pleurochrysis_carterae.AAC.3
MFAVTIRSVIIHARCATAVGKVLLAPPTDKCAKSAEQAQSVLAYSSPLQVLRTRCACTCVHALLAMECDI